MRTLITTMGGAQVRKHVIIGITSCMACGLWGCARDRTPPSTTETAGASNPEVCKANSEIAAKPTEGPIEAVAPAERIEVEKEDYFDGTPKSRQEFKVDADGDKTPHGLLQLWWEDGKTMKLEMRFRDGLAHGTKTAWFRDGKVWSQGEYVDGKENGMWVVWYPDGTKQHELPMDHGSFHGTEFRWHQNGQKLLQGEWVHGKQKGFFTYWDENGKLAREIDYGMPKP